MLRLPRLQDTAQNAETFDLVRHIQDVERLEQHARTIQRRNTRRAEHVAIYGGHCEVCGKTTFHRIVSVWLPSLETLNPFYAKKWNYPREMEIRGERNTIHQMCRPCLKIAKENAGIHATTLDPRVGKPRYWNPERGDE